MKSYASFLEGLYLGILTDVRDCYPQEAVEWERDITRLHLLVEKRGLRVFTLELPQMGKHLDKCLSSGQLVPSRIPGMGHDKGVAFPRLFGGLHKLVFDSQDRKSVV